MCNTTSGVNGSLAWELIIGIDEPARKSKIGRQKARQKTNDGDFYFFWLSKRGLTVEESLTNVSSVKALALVTWIAKEIPTVSFYTNWYCCVVEGQ